MIRTWWMRLAEVCKQEPFPLEPMKIKVSGEEDKGKQVKVVLVPAPIDYIDC